MTFKMLGSRLFTLLVVAMLEAQAGPPNVLLILLDDQQAEAIGAYGNAIVQTPHLDRLAKEGMLFSSAYIQGSMQPAVCVPSRASLLCGRNLFRTDPYLMRDDSWPAAFGRAGYETFFTGKWHNDPAVVSNAFTTARSVFLGGMADPMNTPLQDLVAGAWSEPRSSGRHAGVVFADEVIRFFGEGPTEPFFAYLAFDGPHDPHIVPDDYPIRYDPDTLSLPENFLPEHPFDNGEMNVRDEQLLPRPRVPGAVRSFRADYYRYVSFLDAEIGRVLEALDASPFGSNTLVVVTSDSGVALGSHGLLGKQNLYEHSIRVPLLIRGPGVPRGAVSPALLYLHDVVPTLGDLCGVTGPTGGEGRSMKTVVRDPSGAGRSDLVFAYRTVQRAIRDERWKLITYPEVGVTQLFNLEEDPQETNDLSADPSHADRLVDLRRRLDLGLAKEGLSEGQP
jgi:arylsulfatase A-like enzyme